MANTVLTPSIIARESLMVLENNMVMSNLIYHDYSSEYVNVGDTITIRKPTTFVVNEFGSTIALQDATETGVPVKMDKLLDVSFRVTNRDMSLSIVDFSQQFLQQIPRRARACVHRCQNEERLEHHGVVVPVADQRVHARQATKNVRHADGQRDTATGSSG